MVVESGVNPTCIAKSSKPNNKIDCCTRTTTPTAVINPRKRARLIRLSRKPKRNRPNANVNRPTKNAVKLAIAAAASGSNGCLADDC